MGLSKHDHSPVLDYYFNELKDIQAGVRQYDGLRGRMINTSFDLLAYAADRKERDSVVWTLALGTYGKRFGWSGVIDKTKLPFCHSCQACMVHHIHTNNWNAFNNCNTCMQWDVNSTSKVARSVAIIDNYLTTKSVMANMTYPPGRQVPSTFLCGTCIVFWDLIKAVKIARKEWNNKTWTKAKAKVFMKTCGIGGKVQQDTFSEIKKSMASTMG